MAIKVMVLREKFKITKWEDGAVAETESIGLFWVDRDTPDFIDRYTFYGSVSTSYKGQTIKYVSDVSPEKT